MSKQLRGLPRHFFHLATQRSKPENSLARCTALSLWYSRVMRADRSDDLRLRNRFF